jgi:hypothetical protein
MMQLIDKWYKEYTDLLKEADKLDIQRDANSTYYSRMTEAEKVQFDDLRDRAYRMRIEASAVKRCYDQLVAHFTCNA